MKERIKERIKDSFLPLVPVLQCFLVAIFTLLFAILPIAFLFTHLKMLGYFWLPLLIAYYLFLSVVSRQVIRRREMIEERFLYGDELFFQLYPHFKRVEERKKRLKAMWNHFISHLKKND